MGDQVDFPNTLTSQSSLQSVISWLNAFSLAVQSASARNLIQDVGASGAALVTFTDAAANEFPYFTGPDTVGLLTVSELQALIAPSTALGDAQIAIGQSDGVALAKTITGDAGLADTGALTVTRTNGIAFSPSATIDATNASNLITGTVPAARLPTPTLTTLGGVQSVAGVAHQWVAYIDTSGIPHLTQPTIGDLSGGAALTGANDTNVTVTIGGTPGTALLDAASITMGWTGSLAVARGGTGTVSFPAHGVLIGEGTSAFNIAATGVAGQLLIDQGGSSDPAFTAMSGDGTIASSGAIIVTKTNGVAFAASATTNTTNAANISSGILPAARLIGVTRPLAAPGLTYYVRTDGSDSNSGLVDSSSGAFLTWQFACEVVETLDFNNQTVTIQHGNQGSAKTFTAGMTIGTLTGGGILVISGSPTAGWTTISTSGDCINAFASGNTTITPQQMTLTSSGLNLIQLSYQCNVTLGPSLVFGSATSGAHVFVHDNQSSYQALNTSYSITGGAQAHIEAVNGGHIFLENCPVTLTGTPGFNSFATVQEGGIIQAGGGTTFTGSATGPRFSCSVGGIINSLGNGINFFPGSLPGTTDATSSYDTINNGAWTTVSVTPQPSTGGSFGSASASVEYNLPGGTLSKVVHLKITVVISNVGTATGTVLVPLPTGMVTASGSTAHLFGQDGTSGGALLGILNPGSSTIVLNTIANASSLRVSTGLCAGGTIHIA